VTPLSTTPVYDDCAALAQNVSSRVAAKKVSTAVGSNTVLDQNTQAKEKLDAGSWHILRKQSLREAANMNKC
jgi:hypothetical protein